MQAEFDGFWTSVKRGNPDPDELLAIAAMSIQGLVTLCQREQAKSENFRVG
jgi:hypothetical protein